MGTQEIPEKKQNPGTFGAVPDVLVMVVNFNVSENKEVLKSLYEKRTKGSAKEKRRKAMVHREQRSQLVHNICEVLENTKNPWWVGRRIVEGGVGWHVPTVVGKSRNCIS